MILTFPAPSRATISLATNQPVMLPSTVAVPKGQSAIAFTVQTRVVDADVPITLTAAYNKSSSEASFTVKAPVIVPPRLNPPDYKTLVFEDVFAGSVLDATKWQIANWADKGNEAKTTGKDAVEICLRRNVVVSDGALHLISKRESYTATEAPQTGKVFEFTSGMVSTAQLQYFTPPFYMEATIKLPRGSGTWAAWWAARKYEDAVLDKVYQEFDVVEYLGKDVTAAKTTFHQPDAPTVDIKATDWGADWHTFGGEMTLDAARWYVDGVLVREVKLAILPSRMYLVLDVALGGWGGTPDATFNTSEMLVKDVKVYVP